MPEERRVATDDVRRLPVGEHTEPIGNDTVRQFLPHRTGINDAKFVRATETVVERVDHGRFRFRPR